MRTGAGFSTEAVYIFHNMVRKLRTQHKPEFLAAIFESQGPTFRDEVFEAYKATRTETPPDLLEQIPWIRKILEAMRIPVLEYSGFEADDVIGTLARRGVQQGMDVAIVSSDKDMLQLVNDHVCMINPMKDDLCYDAVETEKYMGVRPDQIADLLALKGDSVDNIPGAPGIGDKGARDLITRFGSVENAIEHAAEVERKTYRESLQNNREQIMLSKRLATIHTDVPVEVQLDALALREWDPDALRELYRTLPFIVTADRAGERHHRAGGIDVDVRGFHQIVERHLGLDFCGDRAIRRGSLSLVRPRGDDRANLGSRFARPGRVDRCSCPRGGCRPRCLIRMRAPAVAKEEHRHANHHNRQKNQSQQGSDHRARSASPSCNTRAVVRGPGKAKPEPPLHTFDHRRGHKWQRSSCSCFCSRRS